jgi:catechol 2,3-dioxygenase-like lactoylglutathione lyase family enzyme
LKSTHFAAFPIPGPTSRPVSLPRTGRRKTRNRYGIAVFAWLLIAPLDIAAAQTAPNPALPPPHFHHLTLNSTDPDAAIAFYTKEFPSTARATWEGMPALSSPTHVLIVFNKVAHAPDANPDVTAYWHFGWNVIDSRKSLETFRAQDLLVPFYTDGDGNFAGISSDTFPYPPGVPGRTKAQLAEAVAQNLQPRRVSGNGYIHGPDGAIIEFTGNSAERVDHIHMWQDDPLCAQLWYQTHLEAAPRRGPAPETPVTEANCKVARGAEPSWPSLDRQGTYRFPTGGVVFDDVAMNWYMNQTDKPLAPTAGRLMDHVSLGVGDLDAWIAKLKGEGVTFLRQPYRIGATRAVMIEGPSHEAIELVEAK